jgi:hypothetical protein
LEQEIPYLGTVSMGDDDAVIPGKPRNLADGDTEVFKLFLYGTLLPFSDQGIAA